MKKFILDTNIIINDPSLLKQWSPKCQVYLPSFVLREVNNYGKRNKHNARVAEELHKLIEDSIAGGTIRFAYIDPKSFKRPSPGLFRDNRITTNDYLLAHHSYEFSKIREGKNVSMVTDDVALYNYAKSLGLNTLNLREFHSEWARYKSISLAQAGRGVMTGISGFMRAAAPLAAILLAVAGAGMFAAYFTAICAYLGPGIMTAVLAVLSILVFRARARWKLSFAVLQFLLGLAVIYLGLGASDQPALMLPAALLAGIFLCIGGLDSFGKGVKGMPIEKYWSALFGD